MTSTTRGPYAKTPQVRARILEAALAVFSEGGFRGTTMKKIAQQAGISQRGLVHHFESKEALLEAVLEVNDARNLSAVPDEPGLQTVEALVRITYDRSAPGLVELHSVLSAEATSPDHPAHDHYVERYDGYRDYLTTVFDAMRSNGELRSELDSDALAQMFIALQDGLQVQWLYNPSAIDVESTLSKFVDSLRDPAGDQG